MLMTLQAYQAHIKRYKLFNYRKQFVITIFIMCSDGTTSQNDVLIECYVPLNYQKKPMKKT